MYVDFVMSRYFCNAFIEKRKNGNFSPEKDYANMHQYVHQMTVIIIIDFKVF